MICPMSFAQQFGPHDAPAHGSICIKDECAWWDDAEGACCISSLAAYIHKLRHDILVAAGIEAPDD